MNWTKTPTRAGFWACRYGPDAAGCTAHSLSEHDGKLWAFDGGEFGPCDEWGGEWCELVPVEKQQKVQADSAAMREALEHAHTAINYAVTTGFEDTIKTIVNAALSTNAGRDLLAELQRLRSDLAKAKEDVLLHSCLRVELTNVLCFESLPPRTREGNSVLVEKVDGLKSDLAKAQAQCAELRSEVDNAWHEGFIDGDFGEASADDCWNQSRARKVATGKAVT